MAKPHQGTETFGYRKVSPAEKTRLVDEVFSSVAPNYDVMNDVMSLGIHRLWKRYAANLCALEAHHQVLDLACGSGDMSMLLAPRLSERGHIYAVDRNTLMLNRARARLLDAGCFARLSFIRCSANNLPFADCCFDCVVVAFGLRNMSDQPAVLHSLFKLLKPGGRLIVLEFSRLRSRFAKLYDIWSFQIIPRLGRLCAGDAESYRYLVESIRRHPHQESLLRMLSAAGFERCRYFNLSGGIVAVHRAYRLALSS